MSTVMATKKKHKNKKNVLKLQKKHSASSSSSSSSSSLSLIKQIDETQPYNRGRLVNVFKKHSVDKVLVISLDS